MWNKIAEWSAWTTPHRSFIPWPLSSINRTPSSGRLFFHHRIGVLGAPDSGPGCLRQPELPSFTAYPLIHTGFYGRNSSSHAGFNISRDGVRFGGRSDEVSDEGHWKITATGSCDFGWRAVARRLRRSHHRDSRSGHPRREGELLGLETRPATEGRGATARRVARRDLAWRKRGARARREQSNRLP